VAPENLVTDTAVRDDTERRTAPDEEALLREARRLRQRRWAIRATIVLIPICLGAVIV
jgi:hypothetical protein